MSAAVSASNIIFSKGVQIFGTRKSPETRKALRFFAERGVRSHFVDLNERGISTGEISRFAQKLGIEALIERDSQRLKELGLTAAGLAPAHSIQKIVDDPLLLRQPLVRHENEYTAGSAHDTWILWTRR